MTNPQSEIRNPKSSMRLGIFGGSFDPVHLGHLKLADCCRTQAELDQIWFVPAAQQPLKPQGPQASDAQRLEMLQLACQEEAALVISEIEIRRGGVSYSVDTLRTIHRLHPKAELFFLMGADALVDLPSWHKPAEFCRLATPLVVSREGSAAPNLKALEELLAPERIAQMRANQVAMPPVPISSSQIRELILAGGEWRHLVPPQVADYIDQQGLYQTAR
jgi:nicotinate-nucleotide adenylyltransferase